MLSVPMMAQQQNVVKEKKRLGEGIFAKIVTHKGTIYCKLEYDKAPLTVANFVALAEGDMPNDARPVGEPFYDDNQFHRVVSNFVIQGGDPKYSGAQTSNPGYTFKDEFHDLLLHDRAGILSMANAGANTNSTQFFITLKETPWLNRKHSVFGFVVEGMDVVNSIEQGDKILRIEILRFGKDAKKFNAMDVFNSKK